MLKWPIPQNEWIHMAYVLYLRKLDLITQCACRLWNQTCVAQRDLRTWRIFVWVHWKKKRKKIVFLSNTLMSCLGTCRRKLIWLFDLLRFLYKGNKQRYGVIEFHHVLVNRLIRRGWNHEWIGCASEWFKLNKINEIHFAFTSFILA